MFGLVRQVRGTGKDSIGSLELCKMIGAGVAVVAGSSAGGLELSTGQLDSHANNDSMAVGHGRTSLGRGR